MLLYSTASLIRRLQSFIGGYLLAIALIAFVSIFIGTYAAKSLVADGPLSGTLKAFDSGFLDCLAFSFSCFQGIGVLLPIMAEARSKQNFE